MESTTPTPSSTSHAAPDVPVTLETRFVHLENSLEQRIRDVELEVASRRSYEKVVIILGYAVIAAGILLGFLGYRNMSDITRNLDERIDLRIAANIQARDSTLKSLKVGVTTAKDLTDELRTTKDNWKQQIEPVLKNIAKYDPDADLKGRYEQIMAEDRDDPTWRKRATDIVSRIAEHIETTETAVSSFAATDIFNLAQESRRLNRNDLEYKLINAAYEVSKTSSTRALYLQLQARQGSIQDENKAFNELMRMVAHVTIENPQIVVAEAWNAAEGLRRYTHLIEAINKLIRRQRADQKAFLPSYAIWVKGRAHQRRGLPGDPGAAVKAFSVAVERLGSEGLGTQWAQYILQEFAEQVNDLLRSGVDTAALKVAVDSSGIPQLRAEYNNLSVLADRVTAVLKSTDLRGRRAPGNDD